MNDNRGKPLLVTVFVKDQKGKWGRFRPIENHIAADDIDTHVVYRLIQPLYQYWDKMGIYQRDLSSYDERPIVLNTATGKNCVNCHSFHNYDPDRMLFHMRAGPAEVRHARARVQKHQVRFDANRLRCPEGFMGPDRACPDGRLGLSEAHPKLSPDGRYVLLCMSQYSYFPLYKPDADLYLLDIETGEFRKAEKLNSGRAEGYHCRFSNGRWVVFGSKRRDGICTHLYLSHFDSDGNFSKPLLLTQKDRRPNRRDALQTHHSVSGRNDG